MTSTPLNSPSVQTRRAQLRAWIDTHFSGSQSAFIASTNDGINQINQGELSGLLKTKSFGEKRARRLELQAKMPPNYLDRQNLSATHTHLATGEPHAAYTPTPAPLPPPAARWPFKLVSRERLHNLTHTIGQQAATALLADMDKFLDLMIQKAESEARDTLKNKNFSAK